MRGVLVHEDLAVVVCRPGPAGISPTPGWPSVSGRRQPLKGKHGQKHPLAQKTRLPRHHPYVFDVRIVLLMAQWDVYRLPVDFALVRRPAWCQEVVVTADAASAPRANLALLYALGYWDIVALPHTWKCANSKALKALVTHLPRWKYT
jgi:hypothetical protein